MVHEHAKYQRGDGKARIQPGVHQPIDPTRGPLGSRLFDHHVARWPADAHCKTSDRQHHHRCRCPEHAHATQRQQQCACHHCHRHHAIAVGHACGDKATNEHAHRAAQHVCGQRQRRRFKADAVHGFENGDGETLHHSQRHGGQQKETKAPPHHWQLHECQIVLGLDIGRLRIRPGRAGHHFGRQLVTLCDQQQQNGEIHQRSRHIGLAPAKGHAQTRKEDRRCCPTEVASQPMRAEGVAQARRRNTLVQDGEIHRVKSRVSQACQCGHQHQPGIAGDHRRRHTGDGKYAHRHKQQRPRTQAVHDKTGAGLAHARDHKEDGHQQTQLRKAQAKLGHEHRKQQRQQQVPEVRAGVCQAHQANDGGVLFQGNRLGGKGRGGVAHSTMVANQGNGSSTQGQCRTTCLRSWSTNKPQ